MPEWAFPHLTELPFCSSIGNGFISKTPTVSYRGNDKVRDTAKRHSDLLFLGIMVLVFLAGAAIALWQSNVQRNSDETDFSQSQVPLDALVRSSVQVIPINAPVFEPAQSATQHFAEREPVIAVTLTNEQRAYPLSILIRHEVVNDVIGEHHIAVTYCPLCNSAIVFDRRIDSEYVVQFGVTSSLYNSNFIMYDDATQSWWHQVSGEAIIGSMIGTRLEMLPSLVVGFATFAERYPDGLVLIGDATMPDQHYGINPYSGYDNSDGPLLSNGEFDPRLQPMQRVLAAVVDGQPVAYDFAHLETVGVVNEVVSEQPVVAFWQPGAVSVLDAREIVSSRDVGQAALFHRVWEGQTLTFRSEAQRIVDNETNSEWNIFGEAISGPLTGAALERYDCFQHFWFAWSSTYPQTLLYGS